ncbi:hypothetical protein J6590_080187 [Homalodisca vitripennis]|nr:hypothetical protein J6590_080187 [Homalodisca vitripennis]
MEQQVDVDEAMQRHYDQAEAGNRSNLRMTNRQSGGQKDQTLTENWIRSPRCERNRDSPRDSSNPGGGCTAMRETDAYWFDQFIFIPVDPSSWNSLCTIISLLTSTNYVQQ